MQRSGFIGMIRDFLFLLSSRKTAGWAGGQGHRLLCVLGPWLSADEMESEMFWMKPC